MNLKRVIYDDGSSDAMLYYSVSSGENTLSGPIVGLSVQYVDEAYG